MLAPYGGAQSLTRGRSACFVRMPLCVPKEEMFYDEKNDARTSDCHRRGTFFQ